MRVKLRLESEAKGCDFCTIEPTAEAAERLCSMLKQAGGVRIEGGDHIDDVSWGICLEDGEAFCEITVHDVENE